MDAIVVIKNRELGLMGTDLGAGRLLYGYITQDTNRGWELRTLTPTLPLTLTYFYSCHFSYSHYIIQGINTGVDYSNSYSCYLTLTRYYFLQNDPQHRVRYRNIDFYLT